MTYALVINLAYGLLLLSTCLYSAIKGGWPGKAGALIFLSASILSAIAANYQQNWSVAPHPIFYVDILCLIALYILTVKSRLNWPIWACGLQLVPVVIHFAAWMNADFIPEIYDGFIAFWAIPILVVMTIGSSAYKPRTENTGPRFDAPYPG